ncbi:MAG: hypothetical protein BV456_07915 [Thermoplasmata archaeon M8B2D]|nr:MAG: hypothetical protein BV456_07915 [Thermoplasmata archaeon M8B2D]
MESFGNKLRQARISKKATLRELGEFVGKTIGYISDIEHDRKRPPKLDIVSEMEDFLGIKDGHLLALARKIRSTAKPTLTHRLKMNPELSSVLLRADQLPNDKKEKALNEFLKTLKQFEEET